MEISSKTNETVGSSNGTAPVDDIAMEFKPAKKLEKSMKQTARARFFAAKRLENRDRNLTTLTALASAYIIVLTITPYFLKLPTQVADHINLAATTMAIIVLASSLLQYSRSDVVNAEQHHRGALEINELHRELISKADIMDANSYIHYSDRYNAILQKYSVNHDYIDYLSLQMDRRQDFPWNDSKKITYMWIRVFISNAFMPAIFWALTAMMVLAIFFYALPAQIEGNIVAH